MTLKRVRNPVERIIYFKGMRGMFGMKNQKGGRLLGSLENLSAEAPLNGIIQQFGAGPDTCQRGPLPGVGQEE